MDARCYNPSTMLIRRHSYEIIREVARHQGTVSPYSPSLFDLELQVLLVACSYQPQEVWHGLSNHTFSQIEGAILNETLIQSIAENQYRRLYALRKKIDKYGFMPHGWPRGGVLCRASAEDEAVEKRTSKKVSFREVDRQLSELYADALHYLHTARRDEIISFGAFSEGEELPFAWVSYSPVDRPYKNELLTKMGLQPTACLELTRAWSNDMSPKNTMSMLYRYAHAQLQEIWRKRHRTELRAILTSVNPNLGFTGGTFRAVGFGIVAQKPTFYYYLVDGRAKRHFIPRRELAEKLQTTKALNYIKSPFPLLPTNELAVLLEGRARRCPVSLNCTVSTREYQLSERLPS